MAEVQRSWDAIQNVEMGKPTSPGIQEAIRALRDAAVISR